MWLGGSECTRLSRTSERCVVLHGTVRKRLSHRTRANFDCYHFLPFENLMDENEYPISLCVSRITSEVGQFCMFIDRFHVCCVPFSCSSLKYCLFFKVTWVLYIVGILTLLILANIFLVCWSFNFIFVFSIVEKILNCISWLQTTDCRKFISQQHFHFGASLCCVHGKAFPTQRSFEESTIFSPGFYYTAYLTFNPS